jgi:hypothetical protein
MKYEVGLYAANRSMRYFRAWYRTADQRFDEECSEKGCTV